jgi:hypothetical protein
VCLHNLDPDRSTQLPLIIQIQNSTGPVTSTSTTIAGTYGKAAPPPATSTPRSDTISYSFPKPQLEYKHSIYSCIALSHEKFCTTNATITVPIGPPSLQNRKTDCASYQYDQVQKQKHAQTSPRRHSRTLQPATMQQTLQQRQQHRLKISNSQQEHGTANYTNRKTLGTAALKSSVRLQISSSKTSWSKTSSDTKSTHQAYLTTRNVHRATSKSLIRSAFLLYVFF